MRERVREMQADEADGARLVLAKIATMPERDQSMPAPGFMTLARPPNRKYADSKPGWPLGSRLRRHRMPLLVTHAANNSGRRESPTLPATIVRSRLFVFGGEGWLT